MNTMDLSLMVDATLVLGLRFARAGAAKVQRHRPRRQRRPRNQHHGPGGRAEKDQRTGPPQVAVSLNSGISFHPGREVQPRNRLKTNPEYELGPGNPVRSPTCSPENNARNQAQACSARSRWHSQAHVAGKPSRPLCGAGGLRLKSLDAFFECRQAGPLRAVL